MPFSHVPTTPEGRAVQIAAFELAISQFTQAYPGALTDGHEEEMVAAVIEMAATGNTDPQTLADYAISRAVSKFFVQPTSQHGPAHARE